MILIIGGGITGLSTAAFLEEKGLDYMLIESSPEVGGYCKTIKKDGFVWDYSGHFFHFKRDRVKKYLLERMDESLIKNCVKHTQIFYKGAYVDFPFQKNIHQLDKEEFIDCLYDLFHNIESTNDSFKGMVYKKFGKSISEKFLIPYNEKLYACDLDTLDVGAMGRFFPYADRESIIKNFRESDNTSYNSYFTYPLGGAEEYVKSLLTRVKTKKIFLNERLCSIDKKNKVAITNKRSIQYSQLISTTPFPNLLKYIGMQSGLDLYSSNKVLVFNIGFDSKGKDTINNWVYFPDKDIRFYRVGYYDNIFNTDRMSLYVEIGFSSSDTIDVDEEFKRVISDLEKCGVKQKTQKIISVMDLVMDPAYVHITEESMKSVTKMKKMLVKDSIYSIGRYGSWTYCSIEDNIIEAEKLVNKLFK